MILKSFQVPFDYGLHARPAAKIVSIVKGIQPPVLICYKDQEKRADSILEILTLQISKGEWIAFKFVDKNQEIFDQLKNLLDVGYGVASNKDQDIKD